MGNKPSNDDRRAETAEKQSRKYERRRMRKTQQRRSSRNMTLNNSHNEINAAGKSKKTNMNKTY